MPQYLSDEEVFGAKGQPQYLTEEEVFGSEAPPEKQPTPGILDTIKNYGLSTLTALGKGTGKLEAAAGGILQSPSASALSMLTGGAALADQGITGLSNWVSPASAQLSEPIQRSAQQASDFAAEQRASNVEQARNKVADRSSNILDQIALAGSGLEYVGRGLTKENQDFEKANNPELLRQQKAQADAQGFIENVKAFVDNSLASSNTLIESLPAMLAGLGVGRAAATSVLASAESAATGAAAKAAAAGLNAEAQSSAATAAVKAVQDQAVARASTAGMLSEAGTSAMQGRESTYQQVAGMPLAELDKVPRYQEIKSTVSDPLQARQIFANEVADQLPLLSGIGTGSGTLLTNKLFGMKLLGGKGVATDATAESLAGVNKMTARDLGLRTLQDTTEEGVQGVPEDAVQFGTSVQADPNQKYDFGGSLAQNLMGGLGMGGAGHGFAYGREKYQDYTANPTKPSESAGSAEANTPVEPAQAATNKAAKQPEVSASEKALLQPVGLTALDRVNELDKESQAASERLAELNDPAGGYGPMFDQERTDLAAQAATLAQERADLSKDWPKSVAGLPSSFTTEAGARVDAQYALMDAGDLITSHDEGLRKNPLYPPELQPRERDRAASEMQVSGIVQKLDPARLGLSADAANGSPIVGADGLVESGNARTIALKRVYQANGQKAADYKTFLRDNAAQFGITPEAVDGMAKPVLVRVRTTPVNRAEFARQANASTVAAMAPSEQAKSDANRIDSMEDLNPDDNGDFSNAASRPFVQRFMARLPITEQAGMVGANGDLSTTGYARVRNAVLAKAYGDSPVLARMTESMDDNLRNVSRAFLLVAPKVAAMRAAVKDGNRFDADITPDLMSASEELARIKTEGGSVQDALAQVDLMGEQRTPEAAQLLQFLNDNMRRPRRMADFIGAYMDALDAAGDPNQGSLLGDTQAPAKQDLLKAAERATQNEAENNGTTPAGVAPQNSGQAGQKPGAAQSGGSSTQGDGADAGHAAQGNTEQGDRSEWVNFPKDSGTIGIPRASMPQIKGEHRGALIQFLQERGIAHTTKDVPAKSLKPTQAEFSTKKAEKWSKVREGSDRSVLVSSDGHILDGHHQWVAALAANEPIQAIVLDAPIRELMTNVFQFPSVKQSGDSATDGVRLAAREDFKAAMGELADYIHGKIGGKAMMMPSDAKLHAILVKLFDSAFAVVGNNIREATVMVKEALKGNFRTRTYWNKINNEAYDRAAKASLEQSAKSKVDDLFSMAEQRIQEDLFSAPAKPATAPKPAGRMDGNFKPPGLASVVGKEVAERVQKLVKAWENNLPEAAISAEDRIKAEALLQTVIDAAVKDEPWFDARVRDIGKQFLGSQLGPIKKIGRTAVKLVQENFNVNELKDIVRATIVIDSFDSAQAVLDAIAKKFDVVQINNKAGLDLTVASGVRVKLKASPEGYKDVTAFVRLPGGGVAEIQINIPEMLSAKLSAHVLYEGSRVVDDDPARQDEYAELRDGQIDVYQAALESAKRRFASATQSMNDSSLEGYPLDTGKPRIGISPSLSSSANRNQLPSGNLTYSSPENDDTKSQPSGNLSGTFISPSFDASIAQKTKNGYSEPQQQENSDGNDTDGAAGDQGQGTGAAQKPGSKRQAQRVRAGIGGPDLFGGGVDDTGGQNQEQLGQVGADGVRQQDEGGSKPQSRTGVGRDAGLPAGRDIPAKSGLNYAFGDDDLTYEGSWHKKATQNVEAVELLKKLQADNRQATPDEQKILAKFIGWGAGELANNLFGPKLDKASAALEDYDKAIAAMGDKTEVTNQDYGSYHHAFNVLRAQNDSLTWYNTGAISRAMLDKAKPDAATQRWVALRNRLRAALSKEELAEASRSTQYAHYTSKAVVQSMWKAMDRMGFKGGSVLEPGAGIGIFAGLMPQATAFNSSYTGIEYDGITGAILKQLFPDERILVESFVDTKLPKNFYDVAAGNPPFSGTKILGDPEYAKHAFSLHDYFFAKSIDRVKPGGLVMYVTSRYTMDKLNDKARKYLSERADLVGAIRLPQTAFKQNAGTDVVTDVIFLRKKVPGETFALGQAWGKSVPIKAGAKTFPINEYFHAHPEMVLGQHSDAGKIQNSPEPQYTVTPLAGDIEAHFAKAVENLPADIYKAGRGSSAEAVKVREIDFNPKAKKEGNYYVSDAGVLMQREDGVGKPVELKSPKDVALVKDFVPLRDALKQAHYDQLNGGDWGTSLHKLQTAYATFTKKNGAINQSVAKTVNVKTDELDEDGNPTGNTITDEEVRRSFPLLDKLKDDPDWTLVAALEKVNGDTGEVSPSEFLERRVLGERVTATVATPTDALMTTLNDLGHVDMGVIAQRLGMSEPDVIEALGSAVYEDPEHGWTTADDYLSGNVKHKLQLAREAAKADRRLERNVTALEAHQPDPLSPSQISPRMGMNWIPGDVYSQFMRDKVGISDIAVEWDPRTKSWHFDWESPETHEIVNNWGRREKVYKSLAAAEKAVEKLNAGYEKPRYSVRVIETPTNRASMEDWGIPAFPAQQLMEHAITGAPVKVYTKKDASSKPTFDEALTEAANEKLNKLHTEFEAWVFSEPNRSDRLVQLYNDKFNTTVARSFDGSHLTLPGASMHWQKQVHAHVKRGVWRIVQTGNTYLAHAVGSGKTAQMVMSAMEQKRLGLVKKPMIVVPNHMLKQFASEWLDIYPAARLMVADEHNFHTDNRRRFVSRVALSDLDGVVITHSAFKLLDLDPAFKAKMIEEQLTFFRAALEEAGGDVDNMGKSREPKIKRIEKQIENMEQKLAAAMSSDGKDKNARFDELGVDFLYVDEAHEFRKLDFTTQREVKGLSPQGSGKAFDLYMKSRYLESKTPGRSMVMASGTPVTNTMAELYSVQKMLGYQALVEKGMEDFDSWASMFGREKTSLEPDASGKYESVARFQDFVNVPEMTQMFREFADVLTADYLAEKLGDKRPKVQDGSRTNVITPMTDDYKAFRSELRDRMEASKAWKPSKDEPNNPDPVIRIIGDGRLAAIDMRFMHPELPSNPDSKLNRMIDDVIAAYKETANQEFTGKDNQPEPTKGATMMVFSDLGFGAGVAASRGFSARAWMEKRLRDAGIPPAHVAFMSDFKKSSAKLKLFSDVNAGRVRILVGTSKSMGTGVNAQQRLKDLFHLDSPWYPADLEQREGRIVRQGNKNKEVRIKAYAAKGSYDEQMWGQLANKQMFIDKAMSGDPNVRSIEDAGAADNMSIMAGMVADDPRVLQLAGLNTEIGKLQRLMQAHEDTRATYRQRHQSAQTTMEWNEARLPEAEKSAKLVQDLSGDKFTAKVGSKSFTERTKWAEALIASYKDLTARGVTQVQQVGEISGFAIAYGGETVAGQYRTKLMLATPNPLELVTDAGTSPMGVAMRAQNAVAEVARLPGLMHERIREASATMDSLSARLETPFPMKELLASKITERNALAQELAAPPVVADAVDQDDTAPNETMLSRGTGGGMELQPLQTLAKRIQARMPNMPEVVVLATPADAPAKLLAEIKRQGAMGDVDGSMHEGKLYLFASNIPNALRAEHVLAEHEAAHFGLRAILGNGLDTVMQSVFNNNASVRQAAKDLQERGDLTDAQAAEEVIVDIPSAELIKLKGWRKLVVRAHDWLQDHGFDAMAAKLGAWLDGSLNDQQRADLFVADLVRQARGYVAGKRSGTKDVAGTMLSGSLAQDWQKQEQWLSTEARARGYKDIDQLAEQNYPLFERLAELWRKKNPAENGVLLSRNYMPLVSARSELDSAINDGTSGLHESIGKVAGKASDVILGRTPHVLHLLQGQLGVQGLMIQGNIVDKVFHDKHASKLEGVTPRMLMEGIYKPAMVFQDTHRPGEFVLVTGIITEHGPVQVAIKTNAELPNGSFGAIVTSIYPRGVVPTAGNKLKNQSLSQWIRDERGVDAKLVYADKELTQAVLTGRPNGKARSPGLYVVSGEINDRWQFAVKPTSPTPTTHNVSINGTPVNENYIGWANVAATLQAKWDGAKIKGQPQPRLKDYGSLLAWIDKHYKGDAVDKPKFSRAPLQGMATERANQIIATKAATAKPIDAIFKGLTKVTGIERLTKAMYQKAGYMLDRITPEKVKAGLVSDYGVPEAVIDQRALMQGRQRVQLRQVGSLVERLATLTRAESRVAYEWLNESNEDASQELMKGLPEQSVKVLQDVRQMIDRLSKEAVRMGQLSQDAYERNKFAYLRRSYAKYTLNLTEGEKTNRSRAISILGDQYKGRGLTELATMAQIQNSAPDWWQRKMVKGKADTSLKGEKLIRLERHAPSGEGTTPLPGMEGKQQGKLKEVHYYPAGETLPAKYADWTQAGTFEVRDIKGANAVLWRDFTKAERENMGEIDESRFAITKTLHGMVHDVEVGRYLEWLGQNHAKKPGEVIPGVVVEASERYRDTFKPGEWVEVPDTKIPGTGVAKYGKLAGRYLPGPIWNDLRQTVNGQFRPFGDTYAKILSMWKTSKTALSPAVHTNNIMSNFVMADWHDVTAGHTAKALRIILGAHELDGKGALGTAGNKIAGALGSLDREAAQEIMNRYLDSGGEIGSWATNEVANKQIEPLLAAMEEELAATNGNSLQAQAGVMSALQFLRHGEVSSAWNAAKESKPGKAVRTEASTLIDLYQSEDEVFRLAAWLKAKEEGATDMAAGKLARRSFMDYSINAPWISALRNSALPFVSYTYRAVPMMLEIAANKPHKLMKLMAFAGALNALGVLLAGGDDDKDRKLLPEEKAGRIWGMVPKLIRMPWNDANASPVYLDIRRFIPVGDVFDIGAGHTSVPILPMMQIGGPVNILMELKANKSDFTGKPITLDTDTPAEQTAKVLDYLYKAFAPNILGLPGTYATTNVGDTLAGDNGKGRTDKFGRELSTTQAVASSFGVKLGSYPADVLRKNEQGRVQGMLMEIDKNITALKRERQTNRISDTDFYAKVKAQQEKKQKVIKEFAAKMN